MESLIKHLVGITGNRDQNLLDISVVGALNDLVGAAHVKALEIFSRREVLFVRPRVWVQGGQVISTDETFGDEHDGEPISNFPTLAACIANHSDKAEEITAAGDFVLWLPVWLNDSVNCCLQIISPAAYSSSARDVIEGIFGVYRNFQSLLDYSERDSLTGLLNRKTFDEKFSRMAAAGTGEDGRSRPVEYERRQHVNAQEQWLAVVDVDHFKRVNDQFGHVYGDEVLILVANLLRVSFRAQDRVFRFGGEEFVVLLRSVTREDAGKIFERFRGEVESHDFPQVGRITVSLGFARINLSETPVMILGHADQALYHAKENGRNRVCNYEDLVSNGSLSSQISETSVEFFFDSPSD